MLGRLQRAAQAADVHVHRAFFHKHMVAPHLIQQLRAQDSLPGMPVALEGDVQACARIHALFARVGAQPFSLAAGSKAAYHAALAMASNYLVTLVELASQTLRQAGVATDACPALLAPLMRQSLDNALNMGPLAALTGHPVLR